MKLVKQLPFQSMLDGDLLDCGLWQSDRNVCEFERDEAGKCDTSGFYYGTDDPVGPMFCARHFYQLVVNGDGSSGYTLIDSTEPATN